MVLIRKDIVSKESEKRYLENVGRPNKDDKSTKFSSEISETKSSRETRTILAKEAGVSHEEHLIVLNSNK